MRRRFCREDSRREESECSTDQARASENRRGLETRAARTLSSSKTTSILRVRLPPRKSRSAGLVAPSETSSFIETMLSISSSKRLFVLLQAESATIAKDLSTSRAGITSAGPPCEADTARTFPVNGYRSLEKIPPHLAVPYKIIIIHENTDTLDKISTLLSVVNKPSFRASTGGVEIFANVVSSKELTQKDGELG